MPTSVNIAKCTSPVITYWFSGPHMSVLFIFRAFNFSVDAFLSLHFPFHGISCREFSFWWFYGGELCLYSRRLIDIFPCDHSWDWSASYEFVPFTTIFLLFSVAISGGSPNRGNITSYYYFLLICALPFVDFVLGLYFTSFLVDNSVAAMYVPCYQARWGC